MTSASLPLSHTPILVWQEPLRLPPQLSLSAGQVAALLPKGAGCFLLPLPVPQCCPQADWALHTQTQSSQDSSVLAASCSPRDVPHMRLSRAESPQERGQRRAFLEPGQAVSGGGGPGAHGDPGMSPSLSSCSLTLDGTCIDRPTWAPEGGAWGQSVQWPR